jgi:DNA-directed RNA polymerase specialized sigma24 family protein
MLAALTADEREVVIDHYFLKVPVGDLAGRRGVSKSLVHQQLAKARTKMRDALLETGYRHAA